MTLIKELINYVINERNRIFADTRYAQTWIISHNALPQWWETAAQQYIALRGFADCQWRARGNTNGVIAN